MKVILYAALIVFLAGCGDEKTITNTIITPGAAVGDIVGRVVLYDTVGKYLPNHSGAQVVLENTSYSITTSTDSSGFWTLKNVPAGIYTLSFSKEGFSYMKDFNLSFTANGTLYYHFNMPNTTPGFFPTGLIQSIEGIPSLTLSAFQDLDTVRNYSSTFKASLGSQLDDHKYKGSTLLLGKKDNISADDPTSYITGRSDISAIGQPGNYYFDFNITKHELYSYGFSQGEKVYCVAYCGSMSSVYSYYFDPLLNHAVFSGLSKGHSEIKSFICP